MGNENQLSLLWKEGVYNDRLGKTHASMGCSTLWSESLETLKYIWLVFYRGASTLVGGVTSMVGWGAEQHLLNSWRHAWSPLFKLRGSHYGYCRVGSFGFMG